MRTPAGLESSPGQASLGQDCHRKVQLPRRQVVTALDVIPRGRGPLRETWVPHADLARRLTDTPEEKVQADRLRGAARGGIRAGLRLRSIAPPKADPGLETVDIPQQDTIHTSAAACTHKLLEPLAAVLNTVSRDTIESGRFKMVILLMVLYTPTLRFASAALRRSWFRISLFNV